MALKTKKASPPSDKKPSDNSKLELLPWHLLTWKRIQQARSDNRLHHALLITGKVGLGKLQFASYLAYSLLCTNPNADGLPCGNCRSCHLFAVGNHPDLKLLVPEETSSNKSGDIKVEAIRDLLKLDAISTGANSYKVVIIAPAENMNRHAANSLLKVLEEPSAATLLLLVSSQPQLLLPTIRSRCLMVPLVAPKTEAAIIWLAAQHQGANGSSNLEPGKELALALHLAHGAPIAALQLLKSPMLAHRREIMEDFLNLSVGKANPIIVAKKWQQLDLDLVLNWLNAWLADTLKLQTGIDKSSLTNKDFIPALQRISANKPAIDLHNMWSRVLETNQQLQTNVNPLLLIESLLIYWSTKH